MSLYTYVVNVRYFLPPDDVVIINVKAGACKDWGLSNSKKYEN